VDLDARLVTEMVAVVLDGPAVDVGDWSVTPLGGGVSQVLGISEGVSRLEGVATSGGEARPWSLILKVLRRAPDHDDPADWDYWKREELAYGAGLLADLPPGLDTPRCFGITQFDEDRIGLWLEDVHERGPARWPLDRFGIAARHLGRFNGAYVAGLEPPAWPWLSHGRIREWLARGEPAIPDLVTLSHGPIGRAWWTDETVAHAQRLWPDRDRLLLALDGLPRCLCHHDAFRRNLIAGGDPGGRASTTAVDWVGIGIGAVGEDLATMVAVSLQFLDVDIVDAVELDRIAFEGYVAGLRDAGAMIDERRVRLGYSTAATLLLGLGGAGGWLLWLTADNDRPKAAEVIIGRPIDEILSQWRGLQPFLLDLGDEAVRLAAELRAS
jgi:Phosphotransferase enzyme family